MRTRFPQQFCCALVIAILFLSAGRLVSPDSNVQSSAWVTQPDDPSPPASPVKLIFIHHSTGEAWLADDHGRLGITLRNNNYFVSDTNYGWGPDAIGDRTDIGHWWSWFVGPSRDVYTHALYREYGQHSSYSRLARDPGGENQIIMFKSCFPNSQIEGNPNDPPTVGENPLRGESEPLTVGNAKGIYNDLLTYFAMRQDKLFIVITAPPLVQNATDAQHAANARAFNDWLVNDWLDNYPYKNVAVFDFYNVLTSNGGNPNANDLGRATGNHHRWWNGAVQHVHPVLNNYSAYGSDPDDSHPTPAGGQKASAEFVLLLNVFYHRWVRHGGTVTPTALAPTNTATPTRPTTPTRTYTPGPSPTTGRFRVYLPIILKGVEWRMPPSPTSTLTLSPSETSTSPPSPSKTFTLSSTSVVIQRGTRGNVADAYIWESEPDYTGNWETLYTGRVGEGRKQTLLHFDLSSLGGGVTVHNATLYIQQMNEAGPRTVNVHRILTEWEEDGVTWNNFAGHYDRSVISSFPAADAGWKQADVTAIVRGWLNGSIPNQGLLLDDPTAGPDEHEEYYASEGEDTALRPKLVISLSGE
jgi:hypothetical protein